MTLRVLLIGTCLAAVSGIAYAEPLDALLPQVANEHPQVKAAGANVDAALYGEKEAFSGYLPKVDITASHGFQNLDKSETNPPGEESNRPTDHFDTTVTQNLFNGFRTHGEVDTARLNTSISRDSLEDTRQQVLLEAIAAYIEVLRQRELVSLAGDNMKTLKEQLNLEDERVQRGSGIAVDVLQAKSRLQISTERHTAFSGALEDAVSRYTQVFGKPPELATMREPPAPATPATLEEAIASAERQSHQLKISAQTTEVARKAKTTAAAGFYPAVDVIGSGGYDDNLEGVSGEQTTYAAKVQLTWQLFSGFADHARVAKAGQVVRTAIETEALTRRKVTEEVRLAWSAAATSKHRAELLQNAVNIAGEVYDARKRLRDAGSDTALNVLDAENELYRARIEATAARFDAMVAVYRLHKAMGRLTLDTLGVSAPPAPPVAKPPAVKHVEAAPAPVKTAAEPTAPKPETTAKAAPAPVDTYAANLPLPAEKAATGRLVLMER